MQIQRVLVFRIGILLLVHYTSCIMSQLSPNFYDNSCPNLLSIVSSTYQSLAARDNVVSPSTLRLGMHDCFIQGCDGSILLSSTTVNSAERDYVDNDIPQQAFDTIENIKRAVESSCPGVVSCADIVALASLEAVRFLGGPSLQVPLGRRDSQTSSVANANGNIPSSNLDGDQLISLFASKGLDASDLVALSGAHTIGFAKCRQFDFRLNGQDPFYDQQFAAQLRGQCSLRGGTNVVAFDPPSPFLFDNSYYRDLQNNRGLLLTDQVLFVHPQTKDLVNQFAASQTQFFQAFATSFVKMFSIGVLTGNNGEIRNMCDRINAS
ncbi:hypothetical protein KP509_29G029000 [Ceratopteris richardii]|uniref:Peroxidase n=1 Tax=Ceratopteris richardii TaxID=49495 RepID=A0A8T2R7B7_CERRI|nr:hypothetical protein KP509_29G029000 [Ceratopteris richardii]